MPIDCAVCEAPFEAKRSTAKYCSSTCRTRARRRRAQADAAPDPTDTTPDLLALPKQVHAELAQVGRLNTVAGQQALNVAYRMLSAGDTGSAIAALSRELSRLMALATVGTAQKKNVVDEVQAKRDEILARARQASA